MPEYSYFSFTIKNVKYPGYRKIAAFIFLLNAIFFFYAALQVSMGFPRVLFMAVGSLLFIYGMFSLFSKNQTDRAYITLYIISALIWYTELGTWIPSLLLLGLMILQIMSQTKMTVTIDKDGVGIKSYYEKSYPWHEVNNLVLKDGLLTVDLASNKIFQLEPDLTTPVMIRKGGSLDEIKWQIDEDYLDLERAVNLTLLWKV